MRLFRYGMRTVGVGFVDTCLCVLLRCVFHARVRVCVIPPYPRILNRVIVAALDWLSPQVSGLFTVTSVGTYISNVCVGCISVQSQKRSFPNL